MKSNSKMIMILNLLMGGFWSKKIVLLWLDITGSLISLFFSYWIVIQHFSVIAYLPSYIYTFIIFVLFLFLSFYFLSAYQSIEDRRTEKELEIVVKGVCLGFFFATAFNFILFKKEIFSRYLILSWWLISLIVITFLRFSLREVYKILWKKGYLKQNLLLVGSGYGIKPILDHLDIQKHWRFEFVGIAADFDQLKNIENPAHLPLLGNLNQIAEIVELYKVERVFIIPYQLSYEKVAELSKSCRDQGLSVCIVSDEFKLIYQRVYVEEFTGLLTLESSDPLITRGIYKLVKRLVDLIGASVGLVITSPLYIAISLAIKVGDLGPVFYRRRVLGKDGVEFDAFKFRSMQINADQILEVNTELRKTFEKNYKLKNDPRLTWIGKFIRKYSLDEIPQFINVLKGQMSLVGPRIIVKSELGKYGEWAEKRLTVKPGITGYWQVNGRQETDYYKRVRMDMFYIDYWTIWMDIVILIKTVWKVIKADGAY